MRSQWSQLICDIKRAESHIQWKCSYIGCYNPAVVQIYTRHNVPVPRDLCTDEGACTCCIEDHESYRQRCNEVSMSTQCADHFKVCPGIQQRSDVPKTWSYIVEIVPVRELLDKLNVLVIEFVLKLTEQ